VTNFHDVGEFHARFGLPRVNGSNGEPRAWDEDLLAFRLRFLTEELEEFAAGLNERDHAQVFDALLDPVYVAMGTAHLLGYPWQEGWEAVQRANLQKVRAAADGSDSKRDSRWDVVKPRGWRPPDITAILRRHGFDT
jgi:predicted HAD superfamily Cof-like phosphohydrolase